MNDLTLNMKDLMRHYATELWARRWWVVGIVWLGLYPGPVLQRMEPAAKRYLQLTQPARSASPVAVSGSVVEVRP